MSGGESGVLFAISSKDYHVTTDGWNGVRLCSISLRTEEGGIRSLTRVHFKTLIESAKTIDHGPAPARRLTSRQAWRLNAIQAQSRVMFHR